MGDLSAETPLRTPVGVRRHSGAEVALRTVRMCVFLSFRRLQVLMVGRRGAGGGSGYTITTTDLNLLTALQLLSEESVPPVA